MSLNLETDDAIIFKEFQTGTLLPAHKFKFKLLKVESSPIGNRQLAHLSFDFGKATAHIILDTSFPGKGVIQYKDGKKVILSDCRGTFNKKTELPSPR